MNLWGKIFGWCFVAVCSFLILTGVVLAPGYTQMLTDKTLPEEVIGERPGCPGGRFACRERGAGWETGRRQKAGDDYGSPVPPALAVNEDYFVMPFLLVIHAPVAFKL